MKPNVGNRDDYDITGGIKVYKEYLIFQASLPQNQVVGEISTEFC